MSFELRIEAEASFDVYVAVEPGVDCELLSRVLTELDRAGARAVSSFGTAGRQNVSGIIRSCAGVMSVGASGDEDDLLMEAAALGRPYTRITCDRGDSLDSFLEQLHRSAPTMPAYAFLGVRLHDDFMAVRRAVKCAVERELGLPCLHFDDPRATTNVRGVRERTRLLIQSATLFIADLTHGPSNGGVDSPNTAHEIGTALAYELPVLVTCRKPRRDLYFLAGDLDVLFWADEIDLEHQLSDWLRIRRSTLGRRILNRELPVGAMRLLTGGAV
jgi:hypothetical protein